LEKLKTKAACCRKGEKGMKEEKILELAKRGGKIESAMAELLEAEIKIVAKEDGGSVVDWIRENSKTFTKIAVDLVQFGMMWHGERLKEQTLEALDKIKKDSDNGN
jgi:hypothetical protein